MPDFIKNVFTFKPGIIQRIEPVPRLQLIQVSSSEREKWSHTVYHPGLHRDLSYDSQIKNKIRDEAN